MPNERPLPDWKGEDVFLIGGGPSLKSFDFNNLREKNVIGCNQAFLKGEGICPVCVFGDSTFYERYWVELGMYAGQVVTNYDRFLDPPSWMKVFRRQDEGLCGGGGVLAWNNNTGALAINLALQMGAERIFLLGYDLGKVGDDSHWHDHNGTQDDALYEKFQEGFAVVERLRPLTFPGRQIFNITNGGSRLYVFPRVSFSDIGMEEKL